jgi:hypothetical protein
MLKGKPEKSCSSEISDQAVEEEETNELSLNNEKENEDKVPSDI